jgi:hypothetical protein
VVKRTQAASENYGREKGKTPDRLADTQILVSYRGTPFVGDEPSVGMAGPAAGERAPDVQGLQREGLGFPLRLFDVLRGTEHVLLLQVGDGEADHAISFARSFREQWGSFVRVAAIAGTPLPGTPYFVGHVDANGGFAEAYGGDARAILVRPDGHIGWRGSSWRAPGLAGYLERIVSI